MKPTKCVILVGHGGLPSDCPPELVAEFKRLERQGPSAALEASDAKLRAWPRTPQSDPYKPGLEAVAAALQKKLAGELVLTAYNEFCAPSVEQAVSDAIGRGAKTITLISTMFTRGGVHSEVEIPRLVDALRRAHPGVELRYAWPFELDGIAAMLAAEVRRAEAAVQA